MLEGLVNIMGRICYHLGPCLEGATSTAQLSHEDNPCRVPKNSITAMAHAHLRANLN